MSNLLGSIKNRNSPALPYQPYFYIIGWTDGDLYYMGIEYKKGANPANLWTTYYTSSKVVHALSFQVGRPDIIWTFPCETAEETIELEKHNMKIFDAINDPNWLNQHCSPAIIHNHITIEKIRRANVGRTKQYKRNPSDQFDAYSTRFKKGQKAWNSGHKRSDEDKQKMREGWAKRKEDGKVFAPRSEEWKYNISIKLKGRPKSEETKRKISEALKGQPPKTRSDESRLKQSETMKRKWAERKAIKI